MPKTIITWACGPDGVLSDIAANVSELLGYAPDEIQAHRPNAVPLNGENLDTILAEEREKTSPRSFSFRSWKVKVLCKNGDRKILKVIAYLQYDSTGHLERIRGATWEVSPVFALSSLLRLAFERLALEA